MFLFFFGSLNEKVKDVCVKSIIIRLSLLKKKINSKEMGLFTFQCCLLLGALKKF